MLWCTKRELRLWNNQACTSKPQKRHVLSKKHQRLHGPATLNEIETKKPRQEKILQEKNKTACYSKFDPKAKVDRKTNPVTENDLDILADATDSKCSIVLLMRNNNVKPNPDINDVSSCNETY